MNCWDVRVHGANHFERPMKPIPLLLLSLLASILVLASSSATVDTELDEYGQWKYITKQNFSSQIRRHAHILLVVTVPWSGESRSLRKEIAHLLHKRKEEYSSLRLRYMFKNVEKMLTDIIGASQETTLSYFHHSLSHKYQGILRAQNILSSLRPYLTAPPENLPLEQINSEQDLKCFFESTDKAVLLLEFCGWTPKLLIKGKKNGTESILVSQGDPAVADFHGKTDETVTYSGNNKQKSGANEIQQCGLETGFSWIPWLGEFTTRNDVSSFDAKDIRFGAGFSCNFEEFQQFESFFSKFLTTAREFLLPPERHRFGVISDRSLLPLVGVGEVDSWSVNLHYAGCPTCSKILNKGEDLNSFLSMGNAIVAELEDDGQSLEPELPANKPSVLLFVDRSSALSETRSKSKEALDAFRELALHNHLPSVRLDQPSTSISRQPKLSQSTSSHPKLRLYTSSKRSNLRDKMSITIVNEEKHDSLDRVTDMQSSSLHEVLEYLLQRDKAAKLSSLAKKAGFQLLSNDFEVKIANPLPSQTVQSIQASVKYVQEELLGQIGKKHQEMDIKSTSAEVPEQNLKSAGLELSGNDERKRDSSDASEELTFSDSKVDDPECGGVGEINLSKVDKMKEQIYVQGFEGLFYFSDGNYRLLKALTGRLKIPSLVIVDPILQQHYLFPHETNFSYALLANFLDGYLNGGLVPYQRSESTIPIPKETARPPFVNLDFREADAIPRIAAKTFSELVFGSNYSETGKVVPAREKDMLVLFSNSWCGFCQRMELVVREVYRALKGYTYTLTRGLESGQTQFSYDNMKDTAQRLPLIYLMDCILNDCSLLFKSMNLREGYPVLVLFPAENGNAVLYEGDMTVASIVKFIAHHGSHSHYLTGDNGILWTVPAEDGMSQNTFIATSSNAVHEEYPAAHEILLKNWPAETTVEHSPFEFPKAKSLGETASHVVVAGSILVATGKLLVVHPFDKSVILVVKADKYTGFQGLIINKFISWDHVRELEVFNLLKEAPLSFGGPLIEHGLPLVALTRADKQQFSEVLPGVRFIGHSATNQEIEALKSGNGSINDYWFFLGYASWGWDQLFHEIDQGAWTISQDSMKDFSWPGR